jgi:hypothetical protein
MGNRAGEGRAIAFVRRHDKLCLFFFVYFIYNINLRMIGSGDTLPAALLPFSILEDHSLYMDRFASFFQVLGFPPYMVAEREGHYLSFYPIVTPILITPLYLLTYILLKLTDYPMDMLSQVVIKE